MAAVVPVVGAAGLRVVVAAVVPMVAVMPVARRLRVAAMAGRQRGRTGIGGAYAAPHSAVHANAANSNPCRNGGRTGYGGCALGNPVHAHGNIGFCLAAAYGHGCYGSHH